MAASASQEQFGYLVLERVIRYHYLYKRVGSPFEGEELILSREHGNAYNHYVTTEKRMPLMLVVFPRNSPKYS